MTFTIKHDELITILDNQQTTIDALIPVSKAAGTGDLVATIDSMPRAMELIQQSVKSTYSIIHQIRSRNELPTL